MNARKFGHTKNSPKGAQNARQCGTVSTGAPYPQLQLDCNQHRAVTGVFAQHKGGSGLHLLAAGLAAVRKLQLLAAYRFCIKKFFF